MGKVESVETVLCYGCDVPNGKHRDDCPAHDRALGERVEHALWAIAEQARQAGAREMRERCRETATSVLKQAELSGVADALDDILRALPPLPPAEDEELPEGSDREDFVGKLPPDTEEVPR